MKGSGRCLALETRPKVIRKWIIVYKGYNKPQEKELILRCLSFE